MRKKLDKDIAGRKKNQDGLLNPVPNKLSPSFQPMHH